MINRMIDTICNIDFSPRWTATDDYIYYPIVGLLIAMVILALLN